MYAMLHAVRASSIQTITTNMTIEGWKVGSLVSLRLYNLHPLSLDFLHTRGWNVCLLEQ